MSSLVMATRTGYKGHENLTYGSYEAARKAEHDYFVCDESGFAQTKDLPCGVYTVHQVSGWEGWERLADFNVYIAKDGKTCRYLVNTSL